MKGKTDEVLVEPVNTRYEVNTNHRYMLVIRFENFNHFFMMQLASLLAQGYIVQIGSGDSAVKYQFHRDPVFVQNIAKSVGFDLTGYLTSVN